MNKKGLSQIVATMLLILLTVGMIAGIWVTINAFVTDKLESTKSCYGLFEKININDEFTCYNSTGEYVKLSIEVKDIDLTALLISVNYGDNADTYTLTNKSQIIQNISFYKSIEQEVKMPGKESGKTYIINKTGVPEKIEIAPKVNNEICEVIDFIENVPTCM